MRLLLVEDNQRLAGFVETGLVRSGFAVDQVDCLEEALAALSTTRYDVLVLDLGLPDGDGLGLVRRVRDRGLQTPILILTARDGLDDRVKGLNVGADDYLVKPFAMEELAARLKALLRRPGNVLGITLQAGKLLFDTVGREARIGGTTVPLSRREMALLELLLRRSGRVVAKDVIEQSLYGFDEEVSSNSIEVLVHRLRRKLQAQDAGLQIHTLRGVGYLLAEDAAAESA